VKQGNILITKMKMIQKIFTTSILCGLMVLAATVTAAHAQMPVPAAATTPASSDDLISAVNALRKEKNLPEYQTSSALMTAAQKHAEYEASIKAFTDVESDGSDETARALAAGYGGGGTVSCNEAVATSNAATPVDIIVKSVWAPAAQRELVLLSKAYTDAGVGIAIKNGQAYYAFVACATSAGGTQSAATTGPGTAAPDTVTPTPKNAVYTVTPAEDGSIIYQVQKGQTLWDISMAFNISVADLVAINSLDAKQPVIYTGQNIIIRLPNTATVTLTPTETIKPPTITPRPTATRRPARATRTADPNATATSQPTIAVQITSGSGFTRQSIGVGVLIVSAAGLLALLIVNFLKKK
jgi:uncharacterized protein YkwD